MDQRFIKDRLTQGFIAGVAGWPLQVVFTYTLYYLHLTKFRYLDFAAVLTFNHLPKGFLESLFAEIVVIVFQGVLGIGFSFLLNAISIENIYFKGWLYGTFCWFAIYAIVTLFRLEHIYPVDTLTALISLLAATPWAIIMTWVFKFLNKKFGQLN
ncbi:MAG TPA: hypothetical protein VHY08_08965 [Bacillota bacterium]|nr:hypothetical protein [Bacillota bacterium]